MHYGIFFILPIKKTLCNNKNVYAKVWLHNSRPDLPYLLVLRWLLGREDPSLWILVQGTLPVSTRAMWKILPRPQQPRFVGFSRNDGWRTRRLWCKHVHEVKYVGCEGLWSNTCATICNIYIYMLIMTSWHPSYSLLDMPIVFCWGFKYILFPTHMSMYKHNFSHLLLAGWTLGKLGPYRTNP